MSLEVIKVVKFNALMLVSISNFVFKSEDVCDVDEFDITSAYK